MPVHHRIVSWEGGTGGRIVVDIVVVIVVVVGGGGKGNNDGDIDSIVRCKRGWCSNYLRKAPLHSLRILPNKQSDEWTMLDRW